MRIKTYFLPSLYKSSVMEFNNFRKYLGQVMRDIVKLGADIGFFCIYI